VLDQSGDLPVAASAPTKAAAFLLPDVTVNSGLAPAISCDKGSSVKPRSLRLSQPLPPELVARQNSTKATLVNGSLEGPQAYEMWRFFARIACQSAGSVKCGQRDQKTFSPDSSRNFSSRLLGNPRPFTLKVKQKLAGSSIDTRRRMPMKP